MSHYKPYQTYKDSGVEWLGKIPKHWALHKLKYLARFSGGGTPSRDVAEYWGGSIPWVSPKDMKSETIHSAEELITESGLSGSTTSLVSPGQILLVVRSGILKHTIPVAINEVEVALNQDMKAIHFDSKLCESRFFLRWIQGFNHDLLQAWLKQGATVESIDQDLLVNTIVPTPPYAERQKIVSYLDREITRIDGLISKKFSFIELISEKRQALITRAVTKGLNSAANMKASGVEWIGDIPEHWSIKRLKHIATIQTGITKGKDNADKQTIEVPYLRVANVQDGYLDLEDVSTINIPTEDLERYLLKKGDVLMNEGGDFDKLGRGHIWQGEFDPCIHQNHVFAVRPNKVHAQWLNTFTGSNPAQFYFMARSKQSTNLASISSTNLIELPVPVPSDDEQLEILAALSEMTARLDKLSSKTALGLKLLKEHRTALITAAVTGQIDLREAS